MKSGGAIYILTNPHHTVLYIGITSHLIMRVKQHKDKTIPGFTARYNIVKLVYYESYSRIEEAIAREKQLKKSSRKRKENLINQLNPSWQDLFNDLK